jgi:hypothetical protein
VSVYLLVGLLLSGLALIFVLYPIVRAAGRRTPLEAEPLELPERRRALYQQVLDLEFDQRLGKVSDEDAREQSAVLLREAAGLLALEADGERDLDAGIEREVAAVRRAMLAVREPELETVG